MQVYSVRKEKAMKPAEHSQQKQVYQIICVNNQEPSIEGFRF